MYELQQLLDKKIDYVKYPDFNLFITCDACDKDLGAVLYQKHDGGESCHQLCFKNVIRS